MSVRDSRKAKFHWQAPDEIEHIRWEWRATSPSGQVGLGVYRALTELATEDKARTVIGSGSEQFRTSQKEIAARAMVSDRSVAKACEELERIGLLAIETDHDGENRPGRPSFYTLLDPPATYERSSDGEVTQRRDGVQTPSETVSDVSAKGTNSVRTSPNKEKKKEQKKEEGAGAPPSPDPLPAALGEPLEQVAAAKGAALDIAAVRRACSAYSDRDLVEEAEKFAAWHLTGNGRGAPLKSLAQAFRNWLKGALPGEGGGGVATATRPGGPAAPRAKEPIVETGRAGAVWAKAKPLLEERLPTARYRIYIEPLEVVGERGKALVLLDTSNHGGGKWIVTKIRPILLEAIGEFDDLEIVDQTLLELEAR